MTPAAITVLVLWASGAGQLANTHKASIPAAFSPFRVEAGGYGTYFSRGGGWWRGFDSTVWIRKSRKFIPAFTFDNRTSNGGTQQYYSAFAYANWTQNFFTTQSVSGTAASGSSPLLFPRIRYDAKAWFKIPPSRRLVAGIGVTGYSLSFQRGTIINPGALYYRGSFVLDWEAFINRTNPGSLWSGSGLFAVQQGHEGKKWAGVTIGAGRQTYRALATEPLEIRYSSVSVDGFYRRWLTRSFGFVVSGGYQDAWHSFQRVSIASHLFFEF